MARFVQAIPGSPTLPAQGASPLRLDCSDFSRAVRLVQILSGVGQTGSPRAATASRGGLARPGTASSISGGAS